MQTLTDKFRWRFGRHITKKILETIFRWAVPKLHEFKCYEGTDFLGLDLNVIDIRLNTTLRSQEEQDARRDAIATYNFDIK